jgi:hypothetical protein
MDSQFIIPEISGKAASVVKAYVDAEYSKVIDGVIPYRIENDNGNLAGYFTLVANGNSISLFQKQLRPAFVQFDVQLSNEINNFIINGGYRKDML